MVVTIGARIEERRKAAGIKSQSALARRVGMPQSTMSSLIKRPYRWSPYLPQLARELGTTVEYLAGETNDPHKNAPPPPALPTFQHILMPVALPSENALAAMFEGLLEVLDRSAPVDELARELAQLLPTGLSQLRGRLIEGAAVAAPVPSAEAAEPLASVDPAPTR